MNAHTNMHTGSRARTRAFNCVTKENFQVWKIVLVISNNLQFMHYNVAFAQNYGINFG